MDPANVREALREIALDLEEGADAVMVKPALAYLDVIRARESASRPPRRLQRQRGVRHGQGRRRQRVAGRAPGTLEVLTGIVRAGADMIITYHALEVAQWLGVTSDAQFDGYKVPGPLRGERSATSRAGSTAPCGPSRAWAGRPSSSSAGRGARIWDADGNEYVDYVGSWGP